MYQVQAELSLRSAATAAKAGLSEIARGQTDFDLSALSVVDSAAVVTLLDWQRAASKLSTSLTLHGAPANLLSLMRLYGVADLFTIIPAERH